MKNVQGIRLYSKAIRRNYLFTNIDRDHPETYPRRLNMSDPADSKIAADFYSKMQRVLREHEPSAWMGLLGSGEAYR